MGHQTVLDVIQISEEKMYYERSSVSTKSLKCATLVGLCDNSKHVASDNMVNSAQGLSHRFGYKSSVAAHLFWPVSVSISSATQMFN